MPGNSCGTTAGTIPVRTKNWRDGGKQGFVPSLRTSGFYAGISGTPALADLARCRLDRSLGARVGDHGSAEVAYVVTFTNRSANVSSADFALFTTGTTAAALRWK